MRRLFLHVGMHKTATTTLQTLCSQYRDWLLERGFVYPRILLRSAKGISINHRYLSESLCARLDSDAFRTFPEYWQREIAPQLQAHSTQDVLISAEGFSYFALAKGAQRREALQRCLAGFEVFVVIYLRRQDQWYEAMHNQDVKRTSDSRSLAAYVADGIAKGRADYTRHLAFWARTFGEDHLRVRVFEPAQLLHGDIVQDFMTLLGIDDGASLPKIPAQNQRLSPPLLELKRAINPHLKDPRQRKRAQRAFVAAQRWLPDRGARTMPYELACQVMQQHAAGNAEVARRYLGRENGVLFLSSPHDETPWQAWQPSPTSLAIGRRLRPWIEPK